MEKGHSERKFAFQIIFYRETASYLESETNPPNDPCFIIFVGFSGEGDPLQFTYSSPNWRLQRSNLTFHPDFFLCGRLVLWSDSKCLFTGNLLESLALFHREFRGWPAVDFAMITWRLLATWGYADPPICWKTPFYFRIFSVHHQPQILCTDWNFTNTSSNYAQIKFNYLVTIGIIFGE